MILVSNIGFLYMPDFGHDKTYFIPWSIFYHIHILCYKTITLTITTQDLNILSFLSIKRHFILRQYKFAMHRLRSEPI